MKQFIKIVKPFEETRTPCPPAGVIGELLNFDGKYYRVGFQTPFVCTHGYTWKMDEPYVIKFLEDEIELIEKNP